MRKHRPTERRHFRLHRLHTNATVFRRRILLRSRNRTALSSMKNKTKINFLIDKIYFSKSGHTDLEILHLWIRNSDLQIESRIRSCNYDYEILHNSILTLCVFL